MKTAFTSNKDNIAISSILAVSLFALASGLFNSNTAVASQAVAVQKLDTIVVTHHAHPMSYSTPWSSPPHASSIALNGTKIHPEG